VLLGVGASLDFLAGAVPRAPRWMSESGLEWLYRLGREPTRLWRRYLVRDPKFLLVVGELLRRRMHGRRSASSPENGPERRGSASSPDSGPQRSGSARSPDSGPQRSGSARSPNGPQGRGG
jgi:hypothetical protein